jgi:adenosylmethionine-8-amino-7-oxononanoate aminotransferase
MTISELDREYLWHPYTPLDGQLFPEVIKAEGSYLYLADGTKLLDGISSWWVSVHGHAHPVLVKALASQASQLDHTLFAGFTHKPAVEVAEKLLSLLGSNQKKVFYSDNGSTAVEVALKWALQYHKNNNRIRSKFIAWDGAFHGDTFGAMSVSGKSIFTFPYNEVLCSVEYLPFPDIISEEDVIERFTTLCSSKEFAAFIFEPLVQGTAGMRMYSPKLLDRLMRIAHQYDVICIDDEVMTGFGRTGTMFAKDQCEVEPDIICISKAVTGGILPIGITTCTQKIVDAFLNQPLEKAFFHGHTYTANPIICKVTSANLDLIMAKEFLQKIQHFTQLHRDFIHELSPDIKSKVLDISSLGILLRVEFPVHDRGYASKRRKFLYEFFIGKGILLRPLGNVVYFMPPLSFTTEEIKYVYDSIVQCIVEIQNLE